MNFNIQKFAEEMALQRIVKKKLSLRTAALQIGISPATLNRIESSKQVPDLETYYKCCKWCEKSMESFFN